MRDFFGFLTIFDWITPAIGLIEDLANDPTLFQTNSWTFFIPYGNSLAAGWNAAQIQKMLKENDIHTWGWQYDWPRDEYFFSVPIEQADEAQYLMSNNGIPVGLDVG